MIKLDINLDGHKAILDRLSAVEEKNWQRILADASTETAFYVRNKVRKQMPEYLDRPKPFTVNSIYVEKGKSRDAEASVLWRKPAGGNSGGRYLIPTVEGGDRRVKGFERSLQSAGLMPPGDVAVPTKDAPKDAYGNVPSSFILKVIAALKFNPSGSKYKNDKRAFFVVVKRQGRGLTPGIYERRYAALGGSIRRIFGFFSRAVYKQTFPFYDLGRKAAEEKFPEKLEQAIQKQIENHKTS
jgi:hypothetical protein